MACNFAVSRTMLSMQNLRFWLPLAIGLLGLFGFVPQAIQAENPTSELIDVKVTGSGGKAVVFIPGLATPGTIWDDTVASVQKEATCYVVSVAGFGGKPPLKREHFLADVRDEIIAYVRGQKLDHPILVGHSLGGVLALDVAAKAPELPGRLIIVDSLPFLAGMMGPGIKSEADAQKIAVAIGQSIGAADPEQFAQGQKQFIGGMVTSPEKANEIAALTGKSDPATVGQAMSELIARDLRPELPAIKCPVLVMGALADKVGTQSSKEEIEKNYRLQYTNLSQAQLLFFEHAKHFIMVDDPKGFRDALMAELGR